MASTPLSTYLNDHLAGSIAGIELLENIATAFAGTDVEPKARQLHQDVVEDKKQLQSLMSTIGIAESKPRKAIGWLGEKATQLKLRLSDPSTGPLRLMESAEAMSLGVEGKRMLWKALSAAAEKNPTLGSLDYARLIERAEDQRRRLELIRIEAAIKAIAPHDK